jgi:hypothetical protein
MQFLAFLKDSYREARSGWVLQAMLALAALLVLFVASISFAPTTVKNDLDSGLRFMTRALRLSPEFANCDFLIEDYTESNPAEPWRSDYRFAFVVRTDTPEKMKKLDDARGLPVSRARVERFMRQSVGSFLDNVTVEKGPETPTERRFTVTTRGTKTPDVTAWRHVPTVLFGLDAPLFITSLREGVYFLEKYLVNRVGAWVLLFISVVITAGFVPGLLQKGAFDLAVSKPIGRSRLLVYKYLGGLTFTALLAGVTVGGVYLAIGLRTGLWNHHFLLAVPLLLFYFAVLYAVSVLVAVLTRSTVLAILATLLAWGLFWVVGKVNNGIDNRLDAEARQAETGNPPPQFQVPKPGDKPEPPDPDEILRRIDPDAPLWGFVPKWSFSLVRAIHFVTPRTYQLDGRMERLIAEGILTENELKEEGYDKPPRSSWAELLAVSGGFVVLVLGLACWRFATRDG